MVTLVSPALNLPVISSKTTALQPDMQASSALRARRMTVVFNPTAGGRRRARLDQTLRLLRDSGCEVAVGPPPPAAMPRRSRAPSAASRGRRTCW